LYRIKQHWRFWYSLFLATACVSTITWYAWHQEHAFRNLHAVKPGVLYRSGQMTKDGLLRALHELNIGTLVNLRGRDYDSKTDSTSWEAELCEKNFVLFVSIPLGAPEHPQKIPPETTQRILSNAAEKFLEVLNNPEAYPRPILLHCLSGVHRTGVMTALYRIEEEGWSKEQALVEMKEMGYRDFASPDPLRDFIVNWVPLKERKEAISHAAHNH
jgi:protein tyrosine/serine phosphatase